MTNIELNLVKDSKRATESQIIYRRKQRMVVIVAIQNYPQIVTYLPPAKEIQQKGVEIFNVM